ncbi:MAG: hypothetical protein ACO38P_08640, partial [Phycisphaerales bacterium]
LIVPTPTRLERRRGGGKPAVRTVARPTEGATRKPADRAPAKGAKRAGARAGDRAKSGESSGTGGKRTISGRGPRIGRKSAARKPPPKGAPRRGAANASSLRPGRGVRRPDAGSSEAP